MAKVKMMGHIAEDVNRKALRSMLTIDMGGKMECMNSISTSCTNNSGCQRRIEKAIQEIREYSPEAEAIINRYLLPGKDKNHISGKKMR